MILKEKLNEPIHNAEEFFFLSTRRNIDDELLDRAEKILRKGVDWKFFSRSVVKSGLAFVFYDSLSKMRLHELIPGEFVDRLKSAYLLTIPGASAQHEEALGLLRLFSEKGIRAIPLKGTFLSKKIYGDIASRGVGCDIDILIDRNNREEAKNILLGEGYVLRTREGLDNEPWYSIFDKCDGTIVDLHWDLNSSVSSPERIEGLWSGSRLIEEEGVKYYELSENDLLVQLSAHFVASTSLTKFRHICDINALVEKYKDILKWSDIIDKSRRWKLSGSLYASLMLSGKLFDSPVPRDVLLRLRPTLIKRVFIHALSDRRVLLYENSKRRRFIDGFLGSLTFQIIEARSLSDWFGIFFPPKERMRKRSYLKRFGEGITRLVKATRPKGKIHI